MFDLRKQLKNKRAKISVIGLGYVGLPLAVELAKAGFKVFGLDVNKDLVKQIKSGQSHVGDVSDEDLQAVIAKNKLELSSGFNLLADSHVIVICVSTPLNENQDPDISHIEDACRKIAKNLKKGQLIILESTTYPGTTEEVVKPILEKDGLLAGKDFFLAFSPERVDPGNKQFGTANIPKVVGGINKKSTDLAAQVYRSFNKGVVKVSSPRVAEMSKLLENIFRIVNISMINELALLCDRMDIDIWEVIEAAKTKPYGFMPFYPGPGAGGHCIPLDPFYLAWKAKEYDFNARFITLAGEINNLMPQHVVNKVVYALNQNKKSLNGAKILVMGVAYKKDISDVRESPILKVIEILREKKAEVMFHDPLARQVKLTNGQEEIMKSKKLDNKLIKSADCLLIGTDHTCYDYEDLAKKAKIVVDLRNAITSRRLKNVYRL